MAEREREREGVVVVLDSGGSQCRAGLAGEAAPRAVLPNCVFRAKGGAGRRAFVADEVHNCDDVQGLTFRRPVDRGYVVNWDAQKEVWDRALSVHLKVKPSECSLLLTEPLFTLSSIQKATDEVVFEEYGFRSYCTMAPPVLSHLHQAKLHPGSLLARSDCSLVVDAGFSFTHAVPIFNGHIIKSAVRRINLGGKALTNYLKELVSYRAWNMMDETYLMEDVKEKLCFCSMDVLRDLNIGRSAGPTNPFRSEYVLPDGVRHRRGYVKDLEKAKGALQLQAELLKKQKQVAADDESAAIGQVQNARVGGMTKDGKGFEGGGKKVPTEPPGGGPRGKRKGEEEAAALQQELSLTNERFMVPETLFHPTDLGMNEAGLAECIDRAVRASPAELQPLLYSSILLTGGSTLFPFFRERLEAELRPLVPDEYDLRLHTPPSPVLSAWCGGSLFASSEEFKGRAVTKREYEEKGSLLCRKRFAQ